MKFIWGMRRAAKKGVEAEKDRKEKEGKVWKEGVKTEGGRERQICGFKKFFFVLFRQGLTRGALLEFIEI